MGRPHRIPPDPFSWHRHAARRCSSGILAYLCPHVLTSHLQNHMPSINYTISYDENYPSIGGHFIKSDNCVAITDVQVHDGLRGSLCCSMFHWTYVSAKMSTMRLHREAKFFTKFIQTNSFRVGILLTFQFNFRSL